MKKVTFSLVLLLALSFSSCIIVDCGPGPVGRDGYAYYGIDYDHHPIYSYWDNNDAIPYNPAIGQYYLSVPGIYRFEYFINEVEYWYGTYQVFINRGGPGRSDGRPGFDGADTYLMLICNQNGFYEYHENYRVNNKEPMVIDQQIGKFHYKLTIQKGNINERPAQQPKFINESIKLTAK